MTGDARALDLNAGVLAPVTDEVDLAGPSELPVTGSLPPDLAGTLVRTGPNPLSGRFDGRGVLNWWPGAAMWHAVGLREGQAVSYRNRWARTRRWAEAKDPDRAAGLVDSNPNVNLVAHGGEILALAEGGPPVAMTAGLDTVGPAARHPLLVDGSTAHPKLDPITGELVSFQTRWAPPFLRYTVSGPGGEAVVDTAVESAAPAGGPSMMHDLAITATRSIVMDLSVAYDLSMLGEGFTIPVRWFDDRPSRLGILPRHAGDVTWLEIEPCFIQHTVNAYDADDDRVVLDVVRYPWYFRRNDDDGFAPDPLGVLWRYELDPGTETVTETQLDDANLELPRIDERRTGRRNRYLWAAEQPTGTEFRGVVRHDLDTGRVQRHVPPPGDQNSEPVFVPRLGASGSTLAEDDGWILSCVYRAATDTTDLVVLDAADLGAGPVASVHLPRRIPAGFHGAWLPDG